MFTTEQRPLLSGEHVSLHRTMLISRGSSGLPSLPVNSPSYLAHWSSCAFVQNVGVPAARMQLGHRIRSGILALWRAGSAGPIARSGERTPMRQPFDVIVPHQLGKQTARDRLERGLSRIRSEVAVYASSVNSDWSDDQLDFSVRAMGYTLTGRINVLEDIVRVEVDLPWLFALAAEQILARIRQTGACLLR